jgi:hypothetical protein
MICICICDFDRSVDVCSWVEEEMDNWREGLESGDLVRTVFEEQTNFRTWNGGLGGRAWLRLWFLLG